MWSNVAFVWCVGFSLPATLLARAHLDSISSSSSLDDSRAFPGRLHKPTTKATVQFQHIPHRCSDVCPDCTDHMMHLMEQDSLEIMERLYFATIKNGQVCFENGSYVGDDEHPNGHPEPGVCANCTAEQDCSCVSPKLYGHSDNHVNADGEVEAPRQTSAGFGDDGSLTADTQHRELPVSRNDAHLPDADTAQDSQENLQRLGTTSRYKTLHSLPQALVQHSAVKADRTDVVNRNSTENRQKYIDGNPGNSQTADSFVSSRGENELSVSTLVQTISASACEKDTHEISHAHDVTTEVTHCSLPDSEESMASGVVLGDNDSSSTNSASAFDFSVRSLMRGVIDTGLPLEPTKSHVVASPCPRSGYSPELGALAEVSTSECESDKETRDTQESIASQVSSKISANHNVRSIIVNQIDRSLVNHRAAVNSDGLQPVATDCGKSDLIKRSEAPTLLTIEENTEHSSCPSADDAPNHKPPSNQSKPVLNRISCLRQEEAIDVIDYQPKYKRNIPPPVSITVNPGKFA